MSDVLLWWIIVELIGMAVLPVAFRFFRYLPDRGYAFVKPLGLLLIAYPFWLLTTLGWLTNTRGAIVLVGLGVALAGWWSAGRVATDDRRPMTDEGRTTDDEGRTTDDEGRTTADESPNHPITQLAFGNRQSAIENSLALRAWLRHNLALVLATELVFTLAFFGWALVRAYMPEITATEKPMELAFLNAVLQSERFPPLDPWLAGYAISYYYFGYIIAAMLTMLSGVVPAVAFNLMIALLFALAATGAFGLAFNLMALRATRYALRSTHASRLTPYALLAPLFLVVIGNLEGFFEALHAKGWGTREFWQWLDIKGLTSAPVTGTFVPRDNWWWWRASRVIHDVVLGQTQEVIDEFPQFSFLLGDLHPHVLALPFALLALAAALNILRLEIRDWRLGAESFDFLLLPLILGGLFFLNSWDILPYGFILIAAFAVARYSVNEMWNRDATRDFAVFVVALGALSVLLYLPFHLSFQSQAGGILPTLFVKTRLHQYLIMFGLFVFLLVTFLARLAFEQRALGAREWLNRAALPLAAIFSFPLAVMALALGILAASPHLREQARAAFPAAADNFVLSVLLAFFGPLARDPALFIVLAILLTTMIVVAREYRHDDSTLFALLLAFTGFLLTFGVEFVYLRDQFGTRMNTVFKFYFQAWTLFAIAAAYAVWYLARALRGITRALWFGAFAILLGASLVYPALAIPNRADDFARSPTLDGLAWLRESNPDDYAAIEWLRAHAPRGAVIVEAPGASYTYGNRISAATGLPTVLGWAGHESQWRGGSKFFKDDATGIDRAADIQRIYQTIDSKELLTYLDKYAIKFVVVGQTEKSMYGLTRTQIEKFGRVMNLVFEYGDVRIYGR
jgi:YYY domain-containing protein